MANSSDSEGGDVLTIISGSKSEVWKDNPNIIAYLSELSSFGVHQLSQEPERLAEERTYILEQTQDLAFHNYKTFIQTAKCSHEIFQDFGILEEQLVSLLDKLPHFIKECAQFGQEAQQINGRWHQTSLTLSKHPQLLELLEMPQLMDTCVRNNYYDEALELAAYVCRLEKKYGTIPLIASIASDVQHLLHQMLNQLLQQLHLNIQLPTCLKVIGYLRRMDVFTESELRIKFLQARDSWFQSILNSIPRADAHTHITKTIEASRVHLFDIITQYRAIFSDDDPILLSGGRDCTHNDSSIFYSWVALKVQEFLKTLEQDLIRDLYGRIDSVLAQCMYFGLSFSRIGTDFRPLLVPVFHKAILQTFTQAVNEAARNFEEQMQSSSFCSSFSSSSLLTSSLISEENLQPPTSLLTFYPLAQYCNSILSAFNELRLCAPLALASPIVSALKDSLCKVVSGILDFFAAEEATLSKNEQFTFSQFCVLFSTELLPYLNRCLLILFPSANLAKAMGITLQELKKLGEIGRLNINDILHPMEHLLPPKEEEEGIVISVDSNSDKQSCGITSEPDINAG